MTTTLDVQHPANPEPDDAFAASAAALGLTPEALQLQLDRAKAQADKPFVPNRAQRRAADRRDRALRKRLDADAASKRAAALAQGGLTEVRGRDGRRST